MYPVGSGALRGGDRLAAAGIPSRSSARRRRSAWADSARPSRSGAWTMASRSVVRSCHAARHQPLRQLGGGGSAGCDPSGARRVRTRRPAAGRRGSSPINSHGIDDRLELAEPLLRARPGTRTLDAPQRCGLAQSFFRTTDPALARPIVDACLAKILDGIVPFIRSGTAAKALHRARPEPQGEDSLRRTSAELPKACERESWTRGKPSNATCSWLPSLPR